MNRKLEDAMVRLAFGDVSSEEAAALEREAMSDPEAARCLAAYRRMRDGLKDLHEVPDDQLSKERLRHAILSQGLKPRPVRTWRSWSWMPATAAVMALGIMYVRGVPGGGPVSIVGPEGSSTAMGMPNVRFGEGGVDLIRPAAKSATVATNTGGVSPFEPVETSVEKASTRRPRRSHSRPSAREISAEELVQYVLKPVDESGEQEPAALASNQGSLDGGQPDTLSDARAPIIIIDSEKDGATGAQKATEVPSAANVVTSG